MRQLFSVLQCQSLSHVVLLSMSHMACAENAHANCAESAQASGGYQVLYLQFLILKMQHVCLLFLHFSFVPVLRFFLIPCCLRCLESVP